MVMIFKVKKVRDFLMANGYVYTFRTPEHAHKPGPDWANSGYRTKKLCDITVVSNTRINFSLDLEPYVSNSGFSCLWEWIQEIRKLNPKLREITGFLYFVKRR